MASLKINRAFLYESILYICAFLLLLEWIYTFDVVAEVTPLKPMIIFAGICFLGSMIRLKWWLSILLKTIALLVVIFIYDEKNFEGFVNWFPSFISEMLFNIKILLTYQWHDFTPLFRTILILILIWLMSYLLYYWYVSMKRVLFFIVTTILYVSIVHTFLDYNTGAASIRIVVLSVVTLGFSNVIKTIEHEVVRFPGLKEISKIAPTFVVTIVIIIIVGLITPVFSPQWADPVPFMNKIRNHLTGGDSGAVKKVGYGEDDTQLGGSFIQDYTEVFTAQVEQPRYWRIETKDFYTGKGWRNSVEKVGEWKRGGKISLDTINTNVEVNEEKAKVQYKENQVLNKLVYPYGLTNVKSDYETVFRVDKQTEGIDIARTDRKDLSKTYEMEFKSPSFSINDLKKTKNQLPKADENLYKQIPKDLPERVVKLASNITEPYDNTYDKAKAIEQYFGENGFTYQTSDVAVPKKEEDYVDQFLFDSKSGYCDNYSTSMVVMLRSQNIPARWAKGFTAGEKVDNEKENNKRVSQYEITNANAHSWVEVYFEGSGWVSFEPTQGFSNLTDFHQEVDGNEKEEQDEAREEIREADEKDIKTEEKKEKEEKEGKNKQDEKNSKDETKIKNKWLAIGIFGPIILLVAILFYVYRWKIRERVIRNQLQIGANSVIYEKAYHFILRKMDHMKMPLAPGETLKEYASRIESMSKNIELLKLTKIYEQMIYSNKVDKLIEQEFIENWENVVSQI